MTTVVAGATVVVGLYPPEVVTGDIVIEGDRITSVGQAPGPGATAASVIDGAGCLVIPGNVCAHTHAYSALARGMPYRLAPPRDFVERVRTVPSNHSPLYAPAIEPTLTIGRDALVAAARPWLGSPAVA